MCIPLAQVPQKSTTIVTVSKLLLLITGFISKLTTLKRINNQKCIWMATRVMIEAPYGMGTVPLVKRPLAAQTNYIHVALFHKKCLRLTYAEHE